MNVAKKYKTIRLLDSILNSILLGSTIGVFTWYIKAYNVEDSLIAIMSGVTTSIALINIYVKKLSIIKVKILWYVVNFLVLINLLSLSSPAIFMPLSMLLLGIDRVLYKHIVSHYLDVVKNKINIRTLNSDIATISGIGGLISIPLAVALSTYYSDTLYIFTIVAYVTLDIIIIRMYSKLQL